MPCAFGASLARIFGMDVRNAVQQLLRQRFGDAAILDIRELGADDSGDDETTVKAAGYGRPLKITFRQGDRTRKVVLHTATPNDFGHDRRADRAADMLLLYDTADAIPRHVGALDVGMVTDDGTLHSLRGCGETWVLTEFAEGHVYADDLRRIAHAKRCEPEDEARAANLARYLAALHRPTSDRPQTYVRSVRDLLGSGEGIFGIVDGYPRDVPSAPPRRLQAIERQCLDWRWRLRDETERLCRIHGDFHPFNVVLGDEGLVLLDASRGCAGDPADDVTAMTVNYPFFALSEPGSWRDGFRPLWRAFWSTYFEARRDEHLLDVAPPYWTWRTLVLANPLWYPDTKPEVRDTLLAMAEHTLARGRLDLDAVERYLS